MDKGISIPKYRFDEVNEALKKARNRVAVLEEELKQKETEAARLRDEIAQVRSSCEKSLKDLEIREIFVEGGILKEHYDAVIPKLTCRDEEKSDLARAIVDLIVKNREKEKEN